MAKKQSRLSIMNYLLIDFRYKYLWDWEVSWFIIILTMIRRTFFSAHKFKSFVFNNKATFFQQQNFDPSKDYYLTLGVSKNAN